MGAYSSTVGSPYSTDGGAHVSTNSSRQLCD